MAVSYKKLWHILLDRDLKKKDLEKMAGITEYMMRKLTNNEHVTTEVLGKISKALNCRYPDSDTRKRTGAGRNCYQINIA